MREKHRLVASHAPPTRTWLETQARALTRNPTDNLSLFFSGGCPLTEPHQSGPHLFLDEKNEAQRNRTTCPGSHSQVLADCRGPILYNLTALLPNHKRHSSSPPKHVASLTEEGEGTGVDMSAPNKIRKQHILLKLVLAPSIYFGTSARTSLLGIQRK